MTSGLTHSDQDWINKQKWFHSIDFGDGRVSSPRFAKQPPNFSLYGVQHFLEQIDVSGLDCLDVGTVDGLSAFMMKERGAANVVATDLVERETFKFGQKSLGLDIDYRVPAKIEEFDEILDGETFDLIVNAGVLYHVIDPIGSLLKCRRRLKPGGMMILESIHLVDQGKSSMYFCPNSKTMWRNKLINFYWIPSLEALVGMLEMASFEVLGYACSNERISILARAVRPSQTQSSSEMINRLLGRGQRSMGYDENLHIKEFEQQSGENSRIKCQLNRFASWISPIRYRTSLPFQPACTHLSKKDRFWNYVRDALFYAAYRKARLEAAIRAALYR